jgi:hypothetical protein
VLHGHDGGYSVFEFTEGSAVRMGRNRAQRFGDTMKTLRPDASAHPSSMRAPHAPRDAPPEACGARMRVRAGALDPFDSIALVPLVHPVWQEAREFCKEIRLYGGLRSVVSRSQVRASFRAIARLSALSISFHRRKSIGKDRECFALDFLHPLRPAGPTLLNHILTTADAACRPETQWKPRPAIRLVGRKPEGNA